MLADTLVRAFSARCEVAVLVADRPEVGDVPNWASR
jgi:hypothetical protein